MTLQQKFTGNVRNYGTDFAVRSIVIAMQDLLIVQVDERTRPKIAIAFV